MSMEISGVNSFIDISGGSFPATATRQPLPQDPPAVKTSVPKQLSNKELSDLQKVASAFDTRIEFSMNRDIHRIVVKVIDTRTDKVIRELPPKAIQELYRRITEVVGLLFDLKI